VDTDSLHDFVRGVRQGENIPSPDCSHLPVGYAKMNEKEARHEAPRVMAELVVKGTARLHRSLEGLLLPAIIFLQFSSL
jgi:hypothetical protein